MRPSFDHGVVGCPWCGANAVKMSLNSPNQETVYWCENGEVVVQMHGTRAKVVHDFRNEMYDR